MSVKNEAPPTDVADKGVSQSGGAKPEVFTFDPISAMDKSEIFDLFESVNIGKYYTPPIAPSALAKAARVAVHHYSAMIFKRNLLVAAFEPHQLLDRQTFAKWALDYIVFGNGYLQDVRSLSNKRLPMKHALAKFTRRSTKHLDQYYHVTGYKNEHEFKRGSIFHLMEADINQEIYGLPEYLPSLNSALLNESATIFRRNYYKNGSHAGFILYMTDAAQEQSDVDDLRKALKDSKGPGNFKNLFVYAPNGKKEGIQLIPVSDVASKDEFFNIKNVTRDDQLAAHRLPPQLIGVIPNNTGGFGDPAEASKVFNRNEIMPLQLRFEELNKWAGEEIVTFNPYIIEEATDKAASSK